MMDIKCPYCSHGFNLDQGDGEGVEEGIGETVCHECNKDIEYYTNISFSYRVIEESK